MKKLMTVTAAAAAMALGAPALAQSNSTGQSDSDMKAEVVEKAPNGRASVVEIGGTRYPVCNAADQDGCINPREAGLNWGNRALDYWPGQPASSMDDSDM